MRLCDRCHRIFKKMMENLSDPSRLREFNPNINCYLNYWKCSVCCKDLTKNELNRCDFVDN